MIYNVEQLLNFKPFTMKIISHTCSESLFVKMISFVDWGIIDLKAVILVLR